MAYLSGKSKAGRLDPLTVTRDSDDIAFQLCSFLSVGFILFIESGRTEEKGATGIPRAVSFFSPGMHI